MIYDITQEDIDKTIEGFVESMDPLRIKDIPVKEKRKYILLKLIIKSFEINKNYSEKEVNEILKPIYPDYAFFRRYLVDYKFLARTANGKIYWVQSYQDDEINS